MFLELEFMQIFNELTKTIRKLDKYIDNINDTIEYSDYQIYYDKYSTD